MERLAFGCGTKKKTAQSEVSRLNADAASAGAAPDAGRSDATEANSAQTNQPATDLLARTGDARRQSRAVAGRTPAALGLSA